MENQIVFIRTEVSVLRPLTESDVPLLVRWINDPETREFLGTSVPMMEGFEREWVRKLSQQHVDMQNIVLMIETLGDCKPIGLMGLHKINLKDRSATTGAVIGEAEFRGKGYGVASKMHLLKYAFRDLNLNRVTSTVISGNDRSVAYSRRCGYVQEGVIREAVFRGGRYRDHILLGVLRPEWEAAFAKYQEGIMAKEA